MMTMKKFILPLVLVASLMLTGSCSDDEWGNNNPEMANVFYYGFQYWGKNKNDVKFTVAQGQTVAIPTQFFSEQVRSFDVEVFYFTTGTLALGTDYDIVDEQGNSLLPAANGGWSVTWPHAQKGIKNIYLKALSGAKGTVVVQTFNPKSTTDISFENTTIAKTADYEVRAFTQNYKVTVTIK